MWISIQCHNHGNEVSWHMASVRPAHRIREGIYVWERRGVVTVDPPLPVTSRAMVQLVIDELQHALGQRNGPAGASGSSEGPVTEL